MVGDDVTLPEAIIQVLFNLTAGYLLWSYQKRITQLENEKQERMDYLTDEEVIDAELERSARRREAFDSQMPYPPREDSGPSAVVKPLKVSTWSKSASRFKREPLYKGQPRPPRYVPNQPKKDQ